MLLEESLTAAEEMTAALLGAVAAGDEPACAPLLAARGEALEALGASLAAAESGVRKALAPRLAALADSDRQLQTAAAEALDLIVAQDRARFGQEGPGPSPLDREPRNACLDRRA